MGVKAGLRTTAKTESHFAMQFRNISSVVSPAFITGHHVLLLGSTSIFHRMHFPIASILLSLLLRPFPACISPSLHLLPTPQHACLHSMCLFSACISLQQASLPRKHLSKHVYSPLVITPKISIFPIYSSMCLLPTCVSPQQASIQHASSQQHVCPTQNSLRIAWMWCQICGSVDKAACLSSLTIWLSSSHRT